MIQRKDLVANRINILKYLRTISYIHSWQTVRRWTKKYSFPIRHFPNGHPFVIKDEVVEWIIKFSDLNKVA